MCGVCCVCGWLVLMIDDGWRRVGGTGEGDRDTTHTHDGSSSSSSSGFRGWTTTR